MSTILDFNTDVAGHVAYAPLFPLDIFSATLASGTAASVTVPGNANKKWIVAFAYQPGTSVWVSNVTTAAVPAGGTFATTSSELNPSQRMVIAGSILSLITDNTTADVEVSFYAIANP